MITKVDYEKKNTPLEVYISYLKSCTLYNGKINLAIFNYEVT